MSPFDQLRRDDRPESPSPRFAELLRTRIEAALDLPSIRLPERSTPMATTETTVATSTAAAAAVTPYLCVADAAAALDWYATAFGAVETVRYVADDGRIGHAELVVDGAKLMLSDPYPDVGVDAPAPGATTASVSLNLNVADVDAMFERAVAGGATVQRAPEDQPYGERSCTVVDPFGHRWMLQTTIATPTIDEINSQMAGFTATSPTAARPAGAAGPGEPVEVGYLTIGFDDTTKAQAFYGSLFGWVTEPGNMGDEYAHIENTKLPMGMSPAGVASPPVLYFRVDDAAAMAQRAVELGGSIIERGEYESGGDVVCVDDQGREFHLWQPAPGY